MSHPAHNTRHRRLQQATLAAALLSLTPLEPMFASGFLDNSKATLTLKNFYFNQDNRNGGNARSDEWGQAFFLNYKSGFTEGLIGFGLDATGMYGTRLDGGGRSGKTGIKRTPGALFPLESNGKAKDGFGRLALTGKLRLSKTEIYVGTLQPRMPVLIYNDGRLLPQLFHGMQIISNEINKLSIIAGKIEHSTERNSSDSYGLSISGANSGSKAQYSNKFYFAGADYNVTKNLTLQYYFGNLRDFYQQHFVGLRHNWTLPMGSLKTDLRYFNSESDGKNASRAGRTEGYLSSGYWNKNSANRGEVDNRLWSALFTYNLGGHSLGLGYQKSAGSSDWPRINQGTGQTVYLITNLRIGKFASAGEQSWIGLYDYDFAALGIPGLRAGITYVKGWGIKTAASNGKEWQRDIRLNYTWQRGFLKGLSFAWYNATLRSNDTTDRDESRLIMTYSFPLL